MPEWGLGWYASMPGTREPADRTVFSLLCLRAPGSVEKEVAALQDRLYTRLGRVAGLCLPPQIPLLWLPAGEALSNPPAGEALSELLAAGLRLSTRGYQEAGGCLFWGLAAPRPFSAWRRALLDRLSPGGRAKAAAGRDLFPRHAGFFLARREEEQGLPAWPAGPEALSALLGPPRAISFPVAALSLLKIRLLAAPGRWWQGLVWEEAARLPFKKPAPES
jgi:hypothetical protein